MPPADASYSPFDCAQGFDLFGMTCRGEGSVRLVMCEEDGVDEGCDDVVEGVGTGCDAEASDGEKDSEIDACEGAEDEFGQAEGGHLTELAVEEYDVVVEAKEGGRDNDGKNYADGVFEAEHVLKDYH